MNQIQNKKTAITIMLVALLSFIISFLIKEPDLNSLSVFYIQNGLSIPFSDYYVDFFLFNLSLKLITILLVILFGIGIYFLFFKTDDQIKLLLKFDSLKIIYNTKIIQSTTSKLKSFYDFNPEKNLSALDNPREKKEYIKFRKENNITLFIGILFVFSLVFEYSTNYKNPDIIIYLIILILIKKIIGAILCRNLSQYNKGSSTLWTILGFLMPSIALVIVSCGITYNDKSEKLLEKHNNSN